MNKFVDNGKVNWNKVSILSVTDYKSRANNPKPKSMVREIDVYIPIYSTSYEYPFNGECVLLEAWLSQESGCQELMHRWHLLALSEVTITKCTSKTGGLAAAYKVQDKYNIRKIYNKKIHHRMKIFA